MSIIVRAEARVSPRDVDAFREVAEQLAAASEREAGTIQYRWFATGEPTAFVVIEEYVDASAAFEHNRHCAELLERSGRLCTLTTVQIHGELGPELVGWIKQHPHAHGFPPLA
jgi:quinol monooxygenase YgiN